MNSFPGSSCTAGYTTHVAVNRFEWIGGKWVSGAVYNVYAGATTPGVTILVHCTHQATVRELVTWRFDNGVAGQAGGAWAYSLPGRCS